MHDNIILDAVDAIEIAEILDAVDAIEIAEILDYLLERLDILAANDLAKFLFADCSPYGLKDLQADIARLITRLHTSPYSCQDTP